MTGPAYTLKPKDVCIPKFTVKIEGNAVEEGARVFFEGIVDAQPPPGINKQRRWWKMENICKKIDAPVNTQRLSIFILQYFIGTLMMSL